MNEFLNRLVAHMQQCGITNASRPYQYSNYIMLGEVSYWFEQRGQHSVKVVGETFRMNNLPKITAHILSKFAEKFEDLKKEKARQERYAQAREVYRNLEGTPLSFYATDDKWCMEFRHEDKGTVLAAIDYLTDGGFTTSHPPKKTDEEFRVGQETQKWDEMIDAWEKLTEEQKTRFFELYCKVN